MPKFTGDNGLILVGAEIVGELVSFDIDETVDTISSNTMDGSCAADVEPGVYTWSGTIEAFYDVSDTGQQALAIGSVVALTFRPGGGDTGQPELTGSALITGIAKSVAADSMVTASITLQGKGLLIEGVIP